jgi:hypothetical protein
VTHFVYCCPESHYAEWLYTEWLYAEWLYAECHYGDWLSAEWHYAEWYYAEWHYVECDSAPQVSNDGIWYFMKLKAIKHFRACWGWEAESILFK